MAVSAPRRMSAEEFFTLPGELEFTELIDGELVVDTPSVRHQEVVLRLASELLTFSRRHPELGRTGLEVSTRVDDHSVYRPDVWWTRPEHAPDLDTNRHAGPPDIVAEVRSPSTWRIDRGTKRAGYERLGVPELWLVDPYAEAVFVYRRSAPKAPSFDVELTFERDDTLTTPVIPGLELAVVDLFPH